MKICTICLEEGEEVKNYCSCTKSVAAYHRECLREYMKKTGVRKCWFCKKEYKNMSTAFAESDYDETMLMFMIYSIRLVLLGIAIINQYLGHEPTFLVAFLYVVILILTWCIDIAIDIKKDAREVANQ